MRKTYQISRNNIVKMNFLDKSNLQIQGNPNQNIHSTSQKEENFHNIRSKQKRYRQPKQF